MILKMVKLDAVLLGREPTADELKGLNEYEIALDAVCIVVDENSYDGGQYNREWPSDCKNRWIEKFDHS